MIYLKKYELSFDVHRGITENTVERAGDSRHRLKGYNTFREFTLQNIHGRTTEITQGLIGLRQRHIDTYVLIETVKEYYS